MVLFAHGRVDSRNASDFEKATSPIVDSADGGVVADLGNLDYISSAGLQVWLMTARKCRETQRKFVVCSLKDAVLKVAQVVGFDKMFHLYPSWEEALTAEF